MAIVPIWRGHVKDGLVHFDNRPAFDEYVAATLEGKKFELVISRRRKPRSTAQNSYYWAVCLELMKEATGHSKDELHLMMKQKFLTVAEGDDLRVRRTRELSTTEFEEYLEELRQFAATELKINIPNPGDGVVI